MTLGMVKTCGIGQSAAKLLQAQTKRAHGERSETKGGWAGEEDGKRTLLLGLRYSPAHARACCTKKGLEPGQERADG